jgi:hypothetical protein
MVGSGIPGYFVEEQQRILKISAHKTPEESLLKYDLQGQFGSDFV